jgi:hypothetical protein
MVNVSCFPVAMSYRLGVKEMLCLVSRIQKGKAVSAVGTVEKPERFLRQLFQAAVEIIK